MTPFPEKSHAVTELLAQDQGYGVLVKGLDQGSVGIGMFDL